MIDPEFLAILRCPLSATRVPLTVDGSALRCGNCDVRFPIRDGFPVLVAMEAELPAGCEAVSDLPCQRR